MLEKIVRVPAVALASLLATSADGEQRNVLNSIFAVYQRTSIGYMLSQSDLCQWGLADRIQKTYQDDFKAIGMTAAQQTTAWEQAAATQKRMTTLPEDAKDRMKVDTCAASARQRVEHDLN